MHNIIASIYYLSVTYQLDIHNMNKVSSYYGSSIKKSLLSNRF